MFDFDDYLLPFTSKQEVEKFAKEKTTGAESVQVVDAKITHFKVKITLGNGRQVLGAVYNPVGLSGRRLEFGGISIDEIEDFRKDVFDYLAGVDQDEKINIWTGATLLVNEFGIGQDLALSFIKDYIYYETMGGES